MDTEHPMIIKRLREVQEYLQKTLAKIQNTAADEEIIKELLVCSSELLSLGRYAKAPDNEAHSVIMAIFCAKVENAGWLGQEAIEECVLNGTKRFNSFVATYEQQQLRN